MAHFHRRSRCPPRSFRGFFIFNRSRNFLTFRALPPFDYIVKVRFQREPRKFFVLKLTLKITFIFLYFNYLCVLILSENRLETAAFQPFVQRFGCGSVFFVRKTPERAVSGSLQLGDGCFLPGCCVQPQNHPAGIPPAAAIRLEKCAPRPLLLSLVGGRRALIKEKC